MAYPGHGNYPADYDPRTRAWYQAATSNAELTWLPLSIDASTGQPVLTAAAPLRDKHGKIIGATAIDLPLRQLLNFNSIAAPWLNVARLALLRIDETQTLQVVAMKEPMDVDSDWRSNLQTLPMRDIDEQILAAAQNLERGESLEFDQIIINDVSYSVALTAMNDEASAWLALLSPHSAVETAVANALAVVELQRRQTLRHHLIGALVLTLAVILIALYFANRVTAPLIRMSATAEDLAKETGGQALQVTNHHKPDDDLSLVRPDP